MQQLPADAVPIAEVYAGDEEDNEEAAYKQSCSFIEGNRMLNSMRRRLSVIIATLKNLLDCAVKAYALPLSRVILSIAIGDRVLQACKAKELQLLYREPSSSERLRFKP